MILAHHALSEEFGTSAHDTNKTHVCEVSANIRRRRLSNDREEDEDGETREAGGDIVEDGNMERSVQELDGADRGWRPPLLIARLSSHERI